MAKCAVLAITPHFSFHRHLMSPSTLSRSLPGWLFLMGALSAIGPFSVDMYLPAFPSIAKSLQVSSGEVERTLAAYLIGLALAQIFYGPPGRSLWP